ncbi:MAG: glycosyltransferase family 39 protein [Herpetosiphonaceae bacterium]|nr:glycosyltransferase family 39 protein [Herpetosiphonaceae bacterium]
MNTETNTPLRQPQSPARRNYLIVGGLFLLALGLRVWALNWGLPSVEHPDEPALVEVVVRMLQQHDPNPHTFLYPSLFYYLLAVVTRLYSWWATRQGLHMAVQDLPLKTYLWTTAPSVYVWDRMLTAVLGALTIPALYMLGRRMFDRRVALLAGLALAVATFHVEHSHYITTDAPTGLWVVVCLIGAWTITAIGGWQGYCLAGLGAGLAAGTKYNAGTVLIALPIAHGFFLGLRSGRRPFIRMIGGCMVAGVVFLLTTPWAVLDWRHFVAGLRFNAAHYAAGVHGDFVGRWQVGEYVAFAWNSGLLPAGCLLLLLGLPLLLWRSRSQSILLLGVVVAGWLPLLLQAVNFVRNLLPIFPLLILLAAAAAVSIADLLRQVRLRQALLVLLSAGLLLPPAIKTVQLLHYWSQPYTMVAAGSALRSLPRGMLSAVEMNPVQWAGDPVVLPVTRLTDHSLTWYRANGFQYLVINSDERGRDDVAALAQLIAGGHILAQYPERRLGKQPGPGGLLLDLGEHEDRMGFTRQTVRWGEAVTLLGYADAAGAPRSRITPLPPTDELVLRVGQALQVNLYLRAIRPMAHDYALFLHVIDQGGRIVAQRDLPLRYADYPTSHWQPGELVIDRADIALPPLPAGSYQLQVGLYDGQSREQLPAFSPGGGVLQVVLLGNVRVK